MAKAFLIDRIASGKGGFVSDKANLFLKTNEKDLQIL